MRKKLDFTVDENLAIKIKELREEFKKEGVNFNLSEILETYLIFVIPYLEYLLKEARKDKAKAFDIYWRINKEVIGRLFKNLE